MNNVWIITKKELQRFFGDKRMVFSSVILPILMMYIIYAVLGNILGSAFGGDEAASYTIETVNMPSSVSTTLLSENPQLHITAISASDVEQEKKSLQNKNIDLIMVFPEGFDEQVEEYTIDGPIQPAPNIEIFYNSESTHSSIAYSMMNEMLTGYEATLINKFDVNRGINNADVAPESNVIKTMLSTMMPFLIIFMLFSMCMSTASESIAGEKERGTIATLLATPIKRSDIVMGKIIGMSITSIVSALALFVGLAFSLPNYFKSMAGEDAGSIGMDLYKPMDFVWLLLLIISISLLFISFVSILSTLANSIKEAATYTAPFMAVIAVATILPMFSQGTTSNVGSSLIPVYNVTQSMVHIFSGEYNVTLVVIAILSNIVYAFIFMQITAALFRNENVIFKK